MKDKTLCYSYKARCLPHNVPQRVVPWISSKLEACKTAVQGEQVQLTLFLLA